MQSSVLLKRMLPVFVALTALSTLALGEHYLVDLAAAVLYSFAIQWSVQKVDMYRSREQRTGLQSQPGDLEVQQVFDL